MQNLWLDMKAEYEINKGPGKLWLEEIGKLAQQVVNKKILDRLPPSIFGFPSWDKDDLVQLVLTDRLLGRNQAQYVFDTADSIDDARKILRNEINFVLADNRVPNQVDNVWSNLEPRLIELGWTKGKPELGAEQELEQEVVRLILSQKRMRNKGTERFSALFAGPVMDTLAAEIFKIGPNLSSQVLMRSLRAALTIISPSLSIEDVASIEDSTELNSVSNLRSEERLGAERDQYGSRRYEIARDICEKLDSETLEIIFQKAFGANQTEIGAILGLTRQTARFRIEEAELRLFEEIKALGLDFEESGGVVSAMLDILGVQFSEVGG